MKISVLSSKLIKPAYGVAPPTDGGKVVPLTVLDRVNFDQHISGIYFFHPPAPRGADLEAGFAKALAEYREWAGRLTQDHRTVLLNDAGARFVEAAADVTLASVMPLEPTPEVLSLHPSAGDELMLVQATRFACNSLAVGFTAHHLVADGRAMFSFLVGWGQATQGIAIDPVPVHDRASIFKPREPLRVEFEHRGAEFETNEKKKQRPISSSNSHSSPSDVIVVARVHFSLEMIRRLKSQASTGSTAPRRAYNTLQCVVAHLWRCITKARGLNGGDDATRLRITVDGRARMRHPPVPSGYAGNVVLWARPAAVAKDLVGRPLGHAAELISRAVARIDDGHFRSFIDFASSGAVEEEGLVPAADGTKRVRSPDVEVFSLIGLPSGELDFGAGRPELYMPSYLPEEGLVFIVPSFSGDGSVNAQVSLFSDAMEIFRNCCYSLEPASARL